MPRAFEKHHSTTQERMAQQKKEWRIESVDLKRCIATLLKEIRMKLQWANGRLDKIEKDCCRNRVGQKNVVRHYDKDTLTLSADAQKALYGTIQIGRQRLNDLRENTKETSQKTHKLIMEKEEGLNEKRVHDAIEQKGEISERLRRYLSAQRAIRHHQSTQGGIIRPHL